MASLPSTGPGPWLGSGLRPDRQALARPGVAGVLAHTLPEPGASARILTKCGFTYAGDFEDPEEGRLWRWELVKPRPPRET